MQPLNAPDHRYQMGQGSYMSQCSPVNDLDRYTVLEKDILITEGGDPDKLGRGSIWMGEVQRPVFQNHFLGLDQKSQNWPLGFCSTSCFSL